MRVAHPASPAPVEGHFCSGNPFTRLPDVLGDCAALQVVGFKACRITDVPGSALPPALRWLILTDNAISSWRPGDTGQCESACLSQSDGGEGRSRLTA